MMMLSDGQILKMGWSPWPVKPYRKSTMAGEPAHFTTRTSIYFGDSQGVTLEGIANLQPLRLVSIA